MQIRFLLAPPTAGSHPACHSVEKLMHDRFVFGQHPRNVLIEKSWSWCLVFRALKGAP